MSIHRFAARRDANEPQIIARFATHGWHVEQLSGTGMPDLVCWPFTYSKKAWGRQAILVDVKMPKGALKPAQVKKWTALHAKGVPVYVVRTEADVDALVAGTLAPWEPTPHGGYGTKQSKRGLSSRKVKENYTPPRATPPNAAKPMGMGHAIRDQDPAWLKARVPGLGAAIMAEMLKPPGEENYEAALKRAMDAAKEAEVFAPTVIEGVDMGTRTVRVVLSYGDVHADVTGMSNEEVAAKAAALVNSKETP